MNSALRILHLEDDATDAALVEDTLEAGGVACEIIRVDAEPGFSALLDRGGFDLILADYTLPSFDGISALALAMRKRPGVPFLFVSGTLDEEVAIEALKVGATDYVFKTKVSRIVPAVRRALREAGERAERTRAEKALRRSESYLVEAQRLSHTGSFGWDLSSGEMRCSEETFRIFGFEPGTIPVRQTFEQRTHPEDRDRVRHLIDSASQERKGFDFEHRLLMPDGSIRHVRVVGRALQNEPEYVGAVTDVTESRRAEVERKEAQEALRATQAQLAHVNRVMTMGELTASIAHEVSQPLAGILLNGNASRRWLSGAEPNLVEAREAIERLVSDAHRVGDVIARIRGLTRKATIEKERLDLNETIEEVAVLARHEMQTSRVGLRKELRNDLPHVLGDRIQLQQVMLNLFINGIEAMSAVAGRPRELCVATADQDGHCVMVTVRDTGAGLDPQSAARIFDAFYTTKPAGMGMGLSICRSIVQNHGGRLWTESHHGPGTTFRFTIPKYR